MNITKKIEEKVNKIQEGTTFMYQQLSIEPEEYGGTTKVIERLISQGVLKRISPGVFYKPKQTVFGELKPNEEELLKRYLFVNNKRIAYITGLTLYNRMGLTTQIPKTIQIASRDKRISVSLGTIKGRPVKSYVDVTNKNVHLLEILDAFKDFNKIPDLNKESGLKILSKKLECLSMKEKKRIIRHALSYPPRVKAFLGALLDYKEAEVN